MNRDATIIERQALGPAVRSRAGIRHLAGED